MEAGAGRRGIPSLLKSPAARADESGGATSPQQEHIASDITQLVGWTPLVELKRIAQKDNVDARVVGKLECYQPLCSVKDRSALRMIEDAEERGLISPGATTLVEPTSGNMGIALAYIALARGYRFVAVMPAEYSLDKQILLRYLGADLVLTGKEVKILRLASRDSSTSWSSSGKKYPTRMFLTSSQTRRTLKRTLDGLVVPIFAQEHLIS
ncbi:Pyridoxal-5'-phosphate-dependent enzyme family protein [Zea mays]|uniref:Pyridoxal-5'-phosphate-dependent enzyme family protein n=1 Tax=Zea mays TaxID=4577 RepID=A0A1D6NVE6_MAIZE|nr:Pyridoxal-5'-phosphate-dependent enzyme family protein [Zea mays]